MKRINSKPCLSAVVFCVILFFVPREKVHAQNQGPANFSDLEHYEDQKMDYIRQLAKITSKYPDFSYSYVVVNGKVKDVRLKGVTFEPDVEKIKVNLLNLQSNNNMLRGSANRIGVFYDVDVPAQYIGGQHALDQALYSDIHYPFDAKNWGAEGTIYVKFVVDDHGNIPFASTTTDMKDDPQHYVHELERQAVDAIKKTSGHWIPGKVANVSVASFLMIPIAFKLNPEPYIGYFME